MIVYVRYEGAGIPMVQTPMIKIKIRASKKMMPSMDVSMGGNCIFISRFSSERRPL
ncbi:hypothetical protein KSC_012240 [Ktedonobacter sp. SOSP1-52]|nr:hypothetical protein KSC_012240 [Ktedonobacter sp. SOSP1-52]